MVLPHPRDPELLGDGLHEARLTAPADPGEDLYHAVVVVEATDLLEVVLAFEQTYAGPNLSTGVSIANISFIGVFLAKLTIYTPITAEFTIPTLSRSVAVTAIQLHLVGSSILTVIPPNPTA
ncbi:hypothetical protein [Olegusella massiliensis]|uniref:hypothetical protein n=1 Tax=Olegusella massiliensis TaxID=1776381 RepID=UPI00083915E5|nr:hypothetical protein [Olegusella massiliensis]